MCDAVCGKTNNRFTITRGVANSFTFTIKANRTTLPIAIQPSDTFQAHLMKHTDGEPITVNTTALTVVNAPSGKVMLTYPKSVSDTFPSEKGGAEDRYYIRPIYYLVLECNTAANGYFTAKVDKVYVE